VLTILFGCQGEGTHHGFEALAKSLSVNCTSLQVLDLRSCSLDDSEGVSIAQVVNPKTRFPSSGGHMAYCYCFLWPDAKRKAHLYSGTRSEAVLIHSYIGTAVGLDHSSCTKKRYHHVRTFTCVHTKSSYLRLKRLSRIGTVALPRAFEAVPRRQPSRRKRADVYRAGACVVPEGGDDRLDRSTCAVEGQGWTVPHRVESQRPHIPPLSGMRSLDFVLRKPWHEEHACV